jgi:3'-phosphoadenosine 5'-phosphosulfate sulfotransferase (PAPS reductase)/FAD synthetase
MESSSMRRIKLLQMQALPLAEKIEATKRRIREWLDVFPDATVSFSGGKDSTVLLHICRQVKPDIKAVFANTGLEYPEIVQFVEQTENVEIVRPRKSFLEVVQKYGYPVVSKKTAEYIMHVQRSRPGSHTRTYRTTGMRKNGTVSKMACLAKKWIFLCDLGIPISDRCCDFLKKEPLNKVCPTPLIGTMTEESRSRVQAYLDSGCNAFNLKRPSSKPLSFWREVDIWRYLYEFDVPFSKIYELGYKRTGCMFCMFGLHLEKRPHRFDLMAKTHPQLFKWCMDGPLNLRSVIFKVYGMKI